MVRTQLELTHYLQALRIKAEVHVVGLEVQDMGEYGEDWTVRRRRTEGPAQQRSLTGVFDAPPPPPPPPAGARGRAGRRRRRRRRRRRP